MSAINLFFLSLAFVAGVTLGQQAVMETPEQPAYHAGQVLKG